MERLYTAEELQRMLEEAEISRDNTTCQAMKAFQDRRISHLSKELQATQMREWNL